MAHVIFWEKPGCSGNARQRGLLLAAGHTVDVRDLLTARWTPDTLRPFLAMRPVADWFNPRAPQVRDGEVDPTTCDEDTALALLVATPLLIRRPLLQVGDERRCGFAPPEIDAWIGLTAGGAAVPVREAEACAKGAGSPPCPPPRP